MHNVKLLCQKWCRQAWKRWWNLSPPNPPVLMQPTLCMTFLGYWCMSQGAKWTNYGVWQQSPVCKLGLWVATLHLIITRPDLSSSHTCLLWQQGCIASLCAVSSHNPNRRWSSTKLDLLNYTLEAKTDWCWPSWHHVPRVQLALFLTSSSRNKPPTCENFIA